MSALDYALLVLVAAGALLALRAIRRGHTGGCGGDCGHCRQPCGGGQSKGD